MQSFPGKDAKFQISTNAGVNPAWSRDGRELFYIGADGKLMAVDVKTGPRFEHGLPKPLFDAHVAKSRSFDISPDGKRFLMMIQQGDEAGSTSLLVVLNWFAGVKR